MASWYKSAVAEIHLGTETGNHGSLGLVLTSGEELNQAKMVRKHLRKPRILLNKKCFKTNSFSLASLSHVAAVAGVPLIQDQGCNAAALRGCIWAKLLSNAEVPLFSG